MQSVFIRVQFASRFHYGYNFTMQYSLFTQQPEAVTVSELTRYIREMFELDYRLQDIWVQGEVSNLSRPSSGHVYFTLKDSGAAIKCAMWRNSVTPNVQRLSLLPYHRTGIGKLDRLGKPGSSLQLAVPPARRMQELAAVFAARGIAATVGG